MADAPTIVPVSAEASAARKQARLRSIVFLSPSGQIGGAERVLLDLVAGLREADPSCRIAVVASADGPLLSALRALGAQATVIAFPGSLATIGDAAARTRMGTVRVLLRVLRSAPHVVEYIRTLRKWLRRESPDLIHSNGAKMHLMAAFSSAGIAPVIWHLHEYVGARPVMRRALSACATRAALLLANSESVATDARTILRSRVIVRTVFNAVDTDHFRPDGPSLDLDKLSGIAAAGTSTFRIGLVATFATWKGHELFLRALSLLTADTSWRAYIVGGPVYETVGSQRTIADLRGMAAAAGVSDRIGFTGHVTDVPSAIRALDIIVHASTSREPFGLVIAEALACGRPVVTAGTGGAIEVAQSGAGATVVTPRDAGALSAAIAYLIRSPLLRTAAREEARKTAVSFFSRDRFVCGVQEAYASVLIGRKRK